MKKRVTKIICAAVAAVVATGVAAAAGCSQYNSGVSVDYTPSEVKAQSNGGFAVEKDGYIYFINGIESNSAKNDYGTPLKGAIMRVSVDNLNERNYSCVETLVPQIAYSSNYQTGIFVYGDYIYYGTPSTKRNADGIIQSGNLEMKRTKLDGSESMKDAYVTFPSANYDYRFVEGEDGVVYLMYVATAEKLYDESTGVTNLHSYNTATGENTLLAYNISSYLFDAEDKTNHRVYYTMNVKDYAQGSNYGYNQIYTVTADQTEQNEYDFDSILGWNGESDRYINCGDLVFDGIGGRTLEHTVFNNEQGKVNDLAYTYTLETYRNASLFYTRTDSLSSAAYLFTEKDSALTASGWDAIDGNPETKDALMHNGTAADSYKYIFNGDELEAVLISESAGGVSINYVTDGKLSEKIDNKNYYRIVRDGSATMLFTDTDGGYLYYSLSGGNGYTFYRISYRGEWSDYNGMRETDEVNDYTAVRILDLDAATGWYMPELIEDHLIFASETDNMSSYNYIMAFNLEGRNNKELDELNELYNGVIGSEGIISGYSDTEDYPTDIYANLANASRYLFYTADIGYVEKLAAECNSRLEEDDAPVYSENTLNKLNDFLAAEGDWAEYKEYVNKVNGEDVYANRRDYYYSVLGTMKAADRASYADDFKLDYLKSWPEDEPQPSWYDGLNTTERVFFIIGMCVAGLLVLGGIAVGVIFIVRKARGKKLPSYSKRRIKVDTTDDKDINVYEDESAENTKE